MRRDTRVKMPGSALALLLLLLRRRKEERSLSGASPPMLPTLLSRRMALLSAEAVSLKLKLLEAAAAVDEGVADVNAGGGVEDIVFASSGPCIFARTRSFLYARMLSPLVRRL